jgi:hypothetical protein
MKYNQVMRIAAIVLIALTAGVLSVFAQAGNITNSGTISNSGKIQLKGAFSGIPGAINGTVEYNNPGSQTIAASTYTNLTASGGTGDKTLTTGTTVAGVLTVNNTGKSLLLAGGTLNLTGAAPITVSAGTVDFSSGTVNYNGDADQTVYGTSYKNLGISSIASHTKTAGSAVAVTGTLTNAAVATLDFSGYGFTGTGATFANSGTLKSSSTVAVTSGVVIGGTFEYDAAQTVAPASYNNLTFAGAGIKTFTSGSTYSIAGAYTPGAAANVYTGSSIIYNGSSAQTIADVSYANLELSNSAKTWTIGGYRGINGNLTLDANAATSVTGGHNINVSGNVVVNSNLSTDSAVVFANASSTVSGLGDIIGSVMRTHTLGAATAYTYNNSATTVAFTSAQSVPFAMKLTKTNPSGYVVNHSIGRVYVPTYSGLAAGTATVALGYAYSDVGSITQSKLKMFDPTISRTTEIGVLTNYTRDTTTGASAYGSIIVPALAYTAIPTGQQIALDDRYNLYKAIAASADWNIAATWDQNQVPGQYDDAEIVASGITLNAANSINSIVIDASGSLSIATTATASLTVRATAVTTALQNNGSLTVGSAGFVGGLTINANNLDNEKTMTVNNSLSTVLVNGTFTNGSSATLTNAGTVTVQ